MNLFHLALQKFPLFTGLHGIGLIGLAGVMSDGLCCELGNGPRMVHIGKSPFMLTNAKSGLVVVFHLPEWKLSSCLGSKSSWTAVTEPKFQVLYHLN